MRRPLPRCPVANIPQLFEPSESEGAAFATIGDVMRWAEFPSGPCHAAVCEKQSFLSVSGAKEMDHVRVLANLPADHFDDVLQDWQFDGASSPTALLSKGGLVGRTCRIAMGTEDRMSVKRRREDQFSSFSCVESVTRHALPHHRRMPVDPAKKRVRSPPFWNGLSSRTRCCEQRMLRSPLRWCLPEPTDCVACRLATGPTFHSHVQLPWLSRRKAREYACEGK